MLFVQYITLLYAQFTSDKTWNPSIAETRRSLYTPVALDVRQVSVASGSTVYPRAQEDRRSDSVGSPIANGGSSPPEGVLSSTLNLNLT